MMGETWSILSALTVIYLYLNKEMRWCILLPDKVTLAPNSIILQIL